MSFTIEDILKKECDSYRSHRVPTKQIEYSAPTRSSELEEIIVERPYCYLGDRTSANSNYRCFHRSVSNSEDLPTYFNFQTIPELRRLQLSPWSTYQSLGECEKNFNKTKLFRKTSAKN